MKRFMAILAATFCAVAGLNVAGAAANSSSHELRVSKTPQQNCPNAQYTSIQAAVDAASPGDTVTVCPGTYTEQVTIGPGKNGLTLQSLKTWQAVIQFPTLTTPPNALVRVNGARNVTVRGFTITGPYVDSGCIDALSTHYGVRIDGGGSASIRENHITQIRDANPALAGCQDGVAVQVGRQFESQTGSADIEHNLIDNYQKNGPTIDNAGSSATVASNAIDGGGPSNIIARNGIQIGRGAKAAVLSNAVYGNSYSGIGPPPAGDTDDSNDATGILVFEETGGVQIANNASFHNDLGIDVGTASGLNISSNLTYSNVFDGLRTESDTSQNLFSDNRSSSNGSHDCHDDSHGSGTAGTANRWKNDRGTTQTPAGICQPENHH